MSDVARASGDDARREVLARIRTAIGPSPQVPPVARLYRTQGEHAPGSAAVLDLLADRLVDYRAEVRRCAPEEIPATVAAALAERSVHRVVVPPGLPASWLDGADVTRLDDVPEAPLDPAALDAGDGVLTACAGAIADTGTLILDGAAGQGRRALSLVPDLHVVVVLAEQVVQSVPEALARLDPRRPLTLISGPSATSDIELNRVEGVHGPRTLLVILAEPA
jgi:L-lactate dehydrogenase complex protein LldG